LVDQAQAITTPIEDQRAKWNFDGSPQIFFTVSAEFQPCKGTPLASYSLVLRKMPLAWKRSGAERCSSLERPSYYSSDRDKRPWGRGSITSRSIGRSVWVMT